MIYSITDIEERILGVLMEKEIYTPDNYPLTLNSLVAGCNQTTGRSPVMSLSATEVSKTARELGERQLVNRYSPSGRGAEKFAHKLKETLHITPRQQILLALLFLRGPQTLGELHSRSSRTGFFPHMSDLQTTINHMAGRQESPLVEIRPPQPGQKEGRIVHKIPRKEGSEKAILMKKKEPAIVPGEDRIDVLEKRVAQLETELKDLKETLQGLI